MNDKLTLQELIDLLAARHQMEPQDADAFVREFWSLIEEGLKSDNYVKIKGLGTFKLIDTEARESINIQNGERIEIQSHSRVTFSPEASLRDLINRPFAHFETVILNESTSMEDLAGVDERFEAEEEVVEEDVAEEEIVEEVAVETVEEIVSEVVSDTVKTTSVESTLDNVPEVSTEQVFKEVSAKEVSEENPEVVPEAVSEVVSEAIPEIVPEAVKVESTESVQSVSIVEIEEEQPFENQPTGGQSVETAPYSALEQPIEEEQPLEEEQHTEQVHPMAARIADIPKPIVDIMNEVEAIKPSDKGDELLADDESVSEVSKEDQLEKDESITEQSRDNEFAKEESTDERLTEKQSAGETSSENNSSEEELSLEKDSLEKESLEEVVEEKVVQEENTHQSSPSVSENQVSPSVSEVQSTPSASEAKVVSAPVSSQDVNKQLVMMAATAQKEKLESERFCRRSKRRLSWCVVVCASLIGIIIGGLSTAFLIGTKYDRLISTKKILSVIADLNDENSTVDGKVTTDGATLVVDSLENISVDSLSVLSSELQSASTSNPNKLEETAIQTVQKSVCKSEVKSTSKSAAKEETKSVVKSSEKGAKASTHKSVYLSEKIDYKIVGTITTCTIRPGQTLTRVALKYYGNKKIWPYLVMHNKDIIKDPDNVPIGTIIKVPKLESVKSGS